MHVYTRKAATLHSGLPTPGSMAAPPPCWPSMSAGRLKRGALPPQGGTQHNGHSQSNPRSTAGLQPPKPIMEGGVLKCRK